MQSRYKTIVPWEYFKKFFKLHEKFWLMSAGKLTQTNVNVWNKREDDFQHYNVLIIKFKILHVFLKL